MKGTLIKTGQGWMVSRCVGDGVAEVWEELLPLHPDDVKICKQYNEWLGDYSVDWNGKEVEFEIEYLSGLLSQPYAKLVHHSVESNEMIDQVPDIRKMVDLPQMEQNLAKKNLYTEEDMHKAYCAGSNFDMSCLKNEQYYMFKNWFEQFKEEIEKL